MTQELSDWADNKRAQCRVPPTPQRRGGHGWTSFSRGCGQCERSCGPVVFDLREVRGGSPSVSLLLLPRFCLWDGVFSGRDKKT